MAVVISTANGQSDGNTSAGGQQSNLALVFDQQEFGDRFSVLFTSQGDYDYYVVDLTKIGGRFERIYFLNLTYSESKIVNVDSEIEKDQTWFKAYYNYKEEEITCLFNDLKEKTDSTRTMMSAEEKSAWMVKFDKFKNSTENE